MKVYAERIQSDKENAFGRDIDAVQELHDHHHQNQGGAAACERKSRSSARILQGDIISATASRKRVSVAWSVEFNPKSMIHENSASALDRAESGTGGQDVNVQLVASIDGNANRMLVI